MKHSDGTVTDLDRFIKVFYSVYMLRWILKTVTYSRDGITQVFGLIVVDLLKYFILLLDHLLYIQGKPYNTLVSLSQPIYSFS